jgi:hypothetical protein
MAGSGVTAGETVEVGVEVRGLGLRTSANGAQPLSRLRTRTPAATAFGTLMMFLLEIPCLRSNACPVCQLE